MNIVIPEILSGGLGRDMQRSSRMIGDALAGIAQAGAKIYNQAGRIEAKQADNDLNVELSKLYGEAAEKTDGTNQKLADEVKTKADKKFNEYYGKISNSTAKELLKSSYESRIAAYTEGLNKHVADRLWQTTVEGVKIKVADSVRLASQTGDLIGGADAIKQDLESQREYFGGRYDMVFRMAMSLYYSNAIPASLSNPQTRGATLAQLKDDNYRERYYKNLSPDQVSAVERMRASAGEEAIRQDAYFQLHSKYGGNLEAMDRALDNPKTMTSLGITIEDAAYLKGFVGRSIETKERAQKMRWDKTANDVFLNLGQMSPSQIDALVQRGDLSWQLGERFKNDLKAVQDARSNPNTYMRIWRSIQDNVGDEDAMTKIRLEIYSSTGLSYNDKMLMLKKTEEEKDKHDASLVKRGSTYIERVVMPSKGTFFTKAVEEEKLIKAMSAYEEAVKKARQEKGTLTADDINKIAADVADAYVMTPTEAVEESVKANKERQAKREMKKKEETGEKDKYGFVIGGSSRVINGVTWIYIGNNQWQKK